MAAKKKKEEVVIDGYHLSPCPEKPKVGTMVYIDWAAEKMWQGEVVRPGHWPRVEIDEVQVKLAHNGELWSFAWKDLKLDSRQKTK